jgi:hypothetical protein
MPRASLEIGKTIQAVLTTFEENSSLVMRLTLIFSLISALSVLIDVTGAAGFALSLGVVFLLGVIYSGMITALICIPGKSEGAGELWEVVKPVLARIIWVTLLTIVGVLAGLVALIIPCFILITYWSVATQTVVVERTSVFEAFGRSFDLVRGNAWRVFGYILILGLVSLLLLGLSMIASIPFGTGLVGKLVGAFISNALTMPVAAIGPAVLYRELLALERVEAPEEDQDPFAPR